MTGLVSGPDRREQVSHEHVIGANNNQALARGLHILRMLVDEGEPMTATEIARRVGLHQSSASRILATLSETGYVRKNAAGRFEPDYGVPALAAATTRLPLITRPRGVFTAFVTRHRGMTITMCMLWGDEMIYLLRATSGSEPLAFWSVGFPLNISSPALRLLVDLDDDDAVDILAASRRRFGWGGEPDVVPATERALLSQARRMITDDVLLIRDWYPDQHVSGAIPIVTPEPHPVALAIVDETGAMSEDRLTVLLHQTRREVERSFGTPEHPLPDS